ncbi:hypothetical protein CNR22_01765 [Sphingobacteriaceae bacterium]|nr:hypothetical protein CNR22_01765 [Sphingobacteriaceae bacterium]
MKIISILNNYSEYPGLRNCNISEHSGEEFYHVVLNKEFKDSFEKSETVQINLDGTGGYASSFLDEAFGNLVYDFSLENVKKYVEIISEEEPHWKEMIETQTFKEWERRRLEKESPKVTIKHAPWFRMIDKTIQEKVWELPAVV